MELQNRKHSQHPAGILRDSLKFIYILDNEICPSVRRLALELDETN